MKAFVFFGDKLDSDAAVQKKSILNTLCGIAPFLMPTATLLSDALSSKRPNTYDAYDAVWAFYKK